jgi:branched-chain amino acid transport system substrate-binding protein
LTSSEIESYDYRIHVDQAMEGRPDLIYLITFIEDGAKIAIAADSHLSEAYQPFFLAEIPPSSGALADIGVYEGLYGVEQESPTTSNQLLFRERYIELFDTEPDLFADAVYDGVYLIALAMEQAGTTLATAVAGQLRAVSAGGTVVNVGEFARGVELVRQGDEIDYEGASGSIDFDAFGDVSSATYRIWKVENGQFVDLETVTVP